MNAPCPPSAVANSVSSAAIDLERALASLPPGARTVVILHDVEGYTHREIGMALDIDEGTSKSQLSRGRAALRRRLEMRPIEAAFRRPVT